MRKLIREKEMIPKGYGIAWIESDRLVVVAYPIPLNIIFAHIRKVWLWLQQGDWYKTGYDKGYALGKEEGRNYALGQFKEQVIKQEAERLIRRGIEVSIESLKLPKEKVVGYYYKVIEEEIGKLNKKF